jgi:hypothetical protein
MPNTYYVAKFGKDTNNGGPATPWLTISKALSKVVAGDTCYVETGTYNETLFAQYLVGNSSLWTTFSTYQGQSVVIDGTGLYCPAGIYYSSYIQFNGFEIKNSPTRWGIGVYGECHYVTLSNLNIHDTYAGGIYVAYDDVGYHPGMITNLLIDTCTTNHTNSGFTGEAVSLVTVDQFEVKGCLIENTILSSDGVTQQAGLDTKWECTNGKIHNNAMFNVGCGWYCGNINQGITRNIDFYCNLIWGCMAEGSSGILLDSETNPISMTNINMYNNILFGNYRGFQVYWEQGVGGTTKTFTFINNTLYHNGGPGSTEIFLADASGYVGCVVRNNIIVGQYGNTYTLINNSGANNGSKGVTIDHNLFYDAAGYVTGNGQDYGTNSIQANPMLTNPTSDFSLQAGSPAIGAGSSVGAPTTDYASNPRASMPCIGAYEYIATGGFQHGSQHAASFSITENPYGKSCQFEFWLGPNQTTKIATAGKVNFTSGANVPVTCSITMPSAGTYNVYVDVYMLGVLIDKLVASSTVTVV